MLFVAIHSSPSPGVTESYVCCDISVHLKYNGIVYASVHVQNAGRFRSSKARRALDTFDDTLGVGFCQNNRIAGLNPSIRLEGKGANDEEFRCSIAVSIL